MVNYQDADGRGEVMDAARAERCAAWLERVGAWSGMTGRRAGIACEVVRGIVDVTDPEWSAAVEWAAGAPEHRDWVRALELYGPVATEEDRAERAHQCIVAAAHGSDRAMRSAVR